MREETAKKILDQVRNDYDAIAEDFSAARTKLWPELERFGEFAKNGDRVLDVGCGNGRAYQLFAGRAIDYEGIDVSEAIIGLARDKWAGTPASFRVGSMLALPCGDASFGVVLAVASLHHIPSKRLRLAALREMNRVLKPGGWLLMTNWDRWKLKYAKDLVWSMIQKMFGRVDCDFGDLFIPWEGAGAKVRRYYHSFRPRELARLCVAAGFEVNEQYFVTKGERVPWWRGMNLVTICRKS